MTELGTVAAIRRYPVKSMLGQDVAQAVVTAGGLEGDRVVAVIDQLTGKVASAKHPRRWRGLLALAAQWNDGAPLITLPGGTTIAADDAAGPLLTGLLRRDVRLATERPAGASVERPDPRDVIDQGEEAEVPFATIEIGAGTPGASFVDFAPVHVVTTATLARAGGELVRYRPNLVLDTPGGAPFAENDWTGRELRAGGVVLRVLAPTPRCAVPTLAHGNLPRRTEAVRILLEHNRIPLPGMSIGPQPCLGAYAEVAVPGTITVGDRAALA